LTAASRLHARLIALALGLALTASLNCAAWQKVIWPATVTCAGPVAGELVKQIEAILMQGGGTDIGADAVAALEQLASQYGADTIACIVEQLIEGWLRPTGAVPPTPESDAAARGQSFLNQKGVQVRASGN
jgi:hypothetical protein